MNVICPKCGEKRHVQVGGMYPRLYLEGGFIRAKNLRKGMTFVDGKFYQECWKCRESATEKTVPEQRQDSV